MTSWTDYAMEKLKEVLVILQSFCESLISKGDEMFPLSAWTDHAMEKLKEILVILQSFGESVISKVDEVFPPDTREEQIRLWLHEATPYIILGVVLLLVVWCCRRRCCCCCAGREVRTMKAPGRNYRIPRHTFESNPRSYFRGLRGKPVH